MQCVRIILRFPILIAELRHRYDRIDAQLRQVAARVGLEVTPLPLKKEPRLKEICDRLTKLRSCSLDPFEVEIRNLLERTVAFTPLELEYLVNIEKRHGITQY